MVALGPLQEFNLRDEFRPQPNTFFHIIGGATYAYNREHLSHADLNPVFQEINRQYFDGGLSGVRVDWRTIDNRLGEAEKLSEHDYRIWIDRRENTSIAEVRAWKESEMLGAMFQACMKRFE